MSKSKRSYYDYFLRNFSFNDGSYSRPSMFFAYCELRSYLINLKYSVRGSMDGITGRAIAYSLILDSGSEDTRSWYVPIHPKHVKFAVRYWEF